LQTELKSQDERIIGSILLDVHHLKKFYPIQKGLVRKTTGNIYAVNDISFFIREGETLGLVGESGCGKTTTSRCIVRSVDPTAGDIYFRLNSEETINLASLTKNEYKPFRQHIQMIFQDPFSSLNPRMNLFDIVGEPLMIHGMKNRSERQEKVASLLRQVGLRPEYMTRFPHAFSGGERQRISIARALSLNPRLIIADEPVSALDVSVQAQILNLMVSLQNEYNLTYLFVAHDLSVVRHICDRVAVMYVGKLAEMTSTRSLYETPKHPYTEALMAAVPKPDPRLRSERMLLQGDVANPANPPPGCYFHPRCPYAVDVCKKVTPELEEIEKDHFVACHRAQELSLKGILDEKIIRGVEVVNKKEFNEST
jgi:peptide/nickel transport system ATP-binding protein